MTDFTVCFVALDEKQEFKYIAHIMYGQRFPVHNRKDIVDLCAAMNKLSEEPVTYVDVFHVLDEYGKTVWMESEVQPID